MAAPVLIIRWQSSAGEPQALLWYGDHGPGCSCFRCVMVRLDKIEQSERHQRAAQVARKMSKLEGGEDLRSTRLRIMRGLRGDE